MVTCGICPALRKILAKWGKIIENASGAPADNPAPEDFRPEEPGAADMCPEEDIGKLWMEATVGHPLNGREIKEFLAINGDPNTDMAAQDEREMAARVIETWCEASAVAATARLYASMKSAAIDHVVLSNQLNELEKSQFMRLIDRYAEYMANAQTDAAGKLQAASVLTGVSIQYDRLKSSGLASGSDKLAAANVASQLTGGMTAFGEGSSPTVLTAGGNGGQPELPGADVPNRPFLPVARTAVDPNTFRQEFGDDVANTIAGLEAQRPRLDPVAQTVNQVFGETRR